jgi:hypothetical protein
MAELGMTVMPVGAPLQQLADVRRWQLHLAHVDLRDAVADLAIARMLAVPVTTIASRASALRAHHEVLRDPWRRGAPSRYWSDGR